MKQIADRLFAINLCDKYDIDMILYNSACYIICDNIDEQGKIKQLATFLHKEGVREINLFGNQKEIWKAVFDQVDIESIGFNKLSTMMFCDLTTTIEYDDLDKFAKEVVNSKRFGNAYIFFDDKDIFDKVMQKID